MVDNCQESVAEQNAKEVRKEKEGHVSIPWRGLQKVGIFSEGHSSKVIMRFQPEHIDQFRLRKYLRRKLLMFPML